MLPEWAHHLISVFAALGGVMLASWLQRRVNREAYQRTQENLALDLVATMMAVLDNHRSAMWALRNQHHSANEQPSRPISGLLDRLFARWLLKNKPYAANGQTHCEELVRTHQTRQAISGPLTRLHVIVPSLGAAAEEAVDATYAMRRSTDLDDLEVRRLAAHKAAAQFRAAAVQQLRSAGIGLVLQHATECSSKSP